MSTNNLCDESTALSGRVLQSQGVTIANNYTVATYPSTATGTGKILRADGTNWVPTTATFPDTAGANTNVLTSNGTNWTSQPPPTVGNLLLFVTGVLTSAQIKSLHASPVTIVGAPGPNRVLVPVDVSMTMNYGGTNAFVASASQTISLYYSNATLVKDIFNSGIIVGTGNRFRFQAMQPNQPPSLPLSLFTNTDLTLFNPVATEISGNAANNNTMSYQAFYYIMSV